MGELLAMFLELPRLSQIGIAVGVLTPLLILLSYLHPPKVPPPPPPPKQYNVQGDVRVQEKPPGRRR